MGVDPKLSSWEEAVVWLRNQPDRQQLVRDAFYDDPLPDAAARYHASSEWHAIAALIKGRSGRALDIGAGRGIASYALAKDGFAVTALEPDPSNVVGGGVIRALARDTGLPITVVEEFSERLPFEDAIFDVAFARAVLHHASDLDSACREVHRVLKPGGIFIAAREHVISREADLDRFLDQHPLHHLYGGEHAYPLDRYTGALRGAGFASLDVLRPLESEINLFPHTRESLRDMAVNALSRKLPLPIWRTVLGSEPVLSALLALAGRFDNRPGRLYSFVARKATA